VLVKGEGEVEGLTDNQRPRRLGPKRANRIRQAFVLRKQDDVRKYVVRREIKKGEGDAEKTFYKAPKIQRLITEKRIRRKVVNKQIKKDKFKAGIEAHVAYEKLLSKYLKEKKAAKKAEHHASLPTPTKPAAKADVKGKKVDAAPEKPVKGGKK